MHEGIVQISKYVHHCIFVPVHMFEISTMYTCQIPSTTAYVYQIYSKYIASYMFYSDT